MKFKAMWQRMPKRLVSAVLSVALVAGMVLIGGVSSSVPASATISVTAAPTIDLVVPETIYLAKAVGTSTTFWRYANGGPSLSAGTGAASTGVVTFTAPAGATGVPSLSCSGATPTLSGPSVSGNTYTWSITGGTTAAVTQNTGKLITWEVAFTYGGATLHANSYSYVYAPSNIIVGAAARAVAGGKNPAAFQSRTMYHCQSIIAFGGLHGGTVGGTYAVNSTFLSNLFSGTYTLGDNKAVTDYLTSATNGGVAYGNNDAGNNDSARKAGASLDANTGNYINFDSSRYTNLNQIPELYGGYYVTADDNTGGNHYLDLWHGTDIPGVTFGNDNGQGTMPYSTSTGDVYYLHAGNINCGGLAWLWPNNNYNCTGSTATPTAGGGGAGVNKTIGAGQNLINFCAYTYFPEYSNSADTLRVNYYANGYSKASIRTAVNNAVVYPREWLNNWSSVESTLQDAATKLGNPKDASESASVTAGTRGTGNMYCAFEYCVDIADPYNGGTVVNKTQGIYSDSQNGAAYSAGDTVTINFEKSPGWWVAPAAQNGYGGDYWISASPNGISYSTAGMTLTGMPAGGCTVVPFVMPMNFYFEVYDGLSGGAPTTGTGALKGNLGTKAFKYYTSTGPYRGDVSLTDNYISTADLRGVFNTPPAGYYLSHYEVVNGTGVNWPNTNSNGTAVASVNKTVAEAAIASGKAALSNSTPQTVQLVARYTPISYTLTFDPQSGTVSPTSKTVTYDQPYNIDSIWPTPSRTGYTFGGWYTATGGGGTSLGDGSAKYTTAGNSTVYAKWNANTYSVTYDLNKPGTVNPTFNGTSANATYTHANGATYGSAYSVNAGVTAAPTLTGYTFGGWKLGSATYTHGQPYGVWDKTDAVTFVAQWNIKTPTLTFDLAGGSMTPSTPVTQNWNTTYPMPTPTRTGYTFMGWTLNPDGGGSLSSSTGTAPGTFTFGENNATVTAGWTLDSYTISYTLDGGTDPANPETYNVTTPAFTLNNPTKTGYTFAGWTGTGLGSASPSVTILQGSTGNRSYTATYTPNPYKVHFNSNGGTGTMTDQDFTYDVAQDLTANGFTRTGYTFKGWSTTEDPAVNAATNYDNNAEVKNLTSTPSGNVNLYAVWTLDSYTISYTLYGGTVSPANPTTYSVTTLPITLNNPTKTGYTFTGWGGTNGNGTTTQTIPLGSTGNKSFTANWTANQYKIEYNANGGAGTISDQSVTYDQTSNPTLSNGSGFTRTGYTLVGWSRTSGVSNATDYNLSSSTNSVNTLVGSSHFNCVDTNNATMTMYAVWTINQYTLTIRPGDGTLDGALTTPSSVEKDYNQTYKPTDPTPPTGYTFDKWVHTGGGTWDGDKNEFTFTGNGTITATYTAKKYDVIYNLNKPGVAATNPTFDGVNTNPTYTHAKGATYDDLYTVDAGVTDEPTLTGYTFGGWKLDTVTYKHGYPYGKWDIAEDDTVFVAQWTANEYTLFFDAKGGTGAPASKPVTFNEAYQYRADDTPLWPTPTRAGYSFGGWYAYEDCEGAAITATTCYTTADNSTVYAKWDKLKYTLVFYPEGGSFQAGTDASPQYFIEANVVPPEPTKIGYVFDGWYIDRDSDGAADVGAVRLPDDFALDASHLSTASITSNENPTNYYAKWLPVKFKLVWSLEGGTYQGSPVYPTSTDVPYGDEYNKYWPDSSKLAKTNFEFVGWYAVKNDTVIWIDNDTVVDKDTLSDVSIMLPDFEPTTLYAKWKYTGQYTIQYDYQGGEDKVNPLITSAAYLVYPDALFKTTSPADPDDNMPEAGTVVRTGYTFNGWRTEKNGEGDPIAAGDPIIDTLNPDHTKTTTYYANWTPVEYLVEFDPDEGTINGLADGATWSPAPDGKVAYGAKIPMPPVTTKTGYTFLGWFTEDDKPIDAYSIINNATLSSGSLDDPDEPTTFYAHWQANTYPVLYHLQEGTIDGSSNSIPDIVTYGSTYMMGDMGGIPDDPVKTGYIFGGWFTAVNGGGFPIKKAPPTEVTSETLYNMDTDPAKATIFYANWIPVRYKLVYDFNGADVGAPLPGEQKIQYGVTTVPSAPVITRTGYEFVRWDVIFKGAAVGTLAAGGAPGNKMSTEDRTTVTLTAVWKAKQYTVAYDLNYLGSAAAVKSVVTYDGFYGDGVADGVPADPSRAGYDFGGWWTADKAMQIEDDTPVTDATLDLDAAITTFYAQWTANTYTVRFNSNGGTGTMADQGFTYDEVAKNLTANSFTRDGYTFGGWAKSPTGSMVYTDEALVSNLASANGAIVDLYAVWTIVPYTITYLGGGTASPANPAGYDVTTSTFTLTNPTKTGYTFKGWSGTDLADDTNTSVMIALGSTGNKTFTANWTLNTYNITYVLNDGTNNAANPETYTVEDALITLKDPTKDGYDFDGWTPSDNIPAGSTGDKTFNATWTPIDYIITCNTNGGTMPATPTVPAKYNIESAEIAIPNPTKNGYTFEGWEGDGTGTSVTIPANSTGDKTFNATWTPIIYNITYVLDDGLAANPPTYTIKTPDFTLNNPTKTGYTFVGWSGAGLTGITNLTVAILEGSTGDKTFIANWAINSYELTFDLNGGAMTPANPVTKPYGTVYALPVPTHDGWTFQGWEKTTGEGAVSGSTGAASPGTFTFADGDATVQAQWTVNKYTLLYVAPAAPGGTLPLPAPQEIEYGVTAVPAAPVITRTGYTFLRWDIDINGAAAGTLDEGGAPGNIRTKADGATVTLTAVWGINNYTLTLKANGGTLPSGTPGTINGNFETVHTLPVPTYPGYLFNGWTLGATDPGDITDGEFTFGASDAEATAQWKPITYNLVYAYQAGVSGTPPPSVVVTYSPDATRAVPPEPFNPGYKFLGWVLTGSTNATYNNDTFQPGVSLPDTLHVTNDATVTLTAKWGDEKAYKVIYDLNTDDTTATGGGEREVKYGKTYGECTPGFPTAKRTGYDFKGWFTTSAGALPQIESTTTVASPPLNLSGDTTFYAKWEALQYKIVWVLEGGKYNGDTENPVSENVQYDSTYVMPDPKPLRDDYLFIGWYPERNGKGDPIDETTKVTSETLWGTSMETPSAPTEFYAYWVYKGAYPLAYNLQGGKIGIDENVQGGYAAKIGDTFAYGTNMPTDVPPDAPVKTGYTFVGWFTKPDGEGGDEIGPGTSNETLTGPLLANAADHTEVTTYYAHWTAKPYNVNWDMGLDTTSTYGTSSVNYGDNYVLPLTNPTRDGYTFVEWRTEKDGDGDPITASVPATYETLTDMDGNDPAATFYAQWKANTYAVLFDLDGGKIGASYASVQTTVTFGENYTVPANPNKAGYKFEGWFINVNDPASKIITGTPVSAANMNPATVSPNLAATFIAKWTAKPYDVIWDMGLDALSTYATSTVDYDAKYVLPGIPTRTGYTFVEWRTEKNGGGTLITGDVNATSATLYNMDTDPAEPTIFYAKWEPKTYDVEFDAQNGSTPPYATDTVQYGGKYTLPETPKKAGYTFDGWFTAATGTAIKIEATTDVTSATLYNMNTDPAVPTTFYARWTPGSYTLVFDGQGGEFLGGAPSQSFPVSYGGAMPAYGTPTRVGYTFGGWYTKENGGGTQKLEPKPATVDNTVLSEASLYNPATATTFYAKWDANVYQVEYNANGGNFDGGGINYGPVNVYYGKNFTLPSKQPTRLGFTFAGWYTVAASTGGTLITATTPLVSSAILGSDVMAGPEGTIKVFYARWTPVLYKLVFDAQGGVGGAEYDLYYGAGMPDFADPTKSGYEFLGWYTLPGGGFEMLDSDKVDNTILSAASMANPTIATTYYAHWKALGTYLAEFDLKGGNIGGDDTNPKMTVVYNERYELPPGTPVMDGYTFKGWNVEPDGSGAWITATTIAKEPFMNPTIHAPQVTSKFYAQWQAKTYQVTYVLMGGTNGVGGSGADINSEVSFGKKYADGTSWPGEDDTVLVKTGYKFAGWFTTTDGPAHGSLITGGMDIPYELNENAPTLYYAYWAPEGGTAYYVDIYLEDADGDYPLYASNPFTAETGELVSVLGKFYGDAYYTFDPDHAGTKLADIVDPAGTTRLTLYYDRVKVRLHYSLGGGTGLTDPTETFRWGEEYTVPSDPTRLPGYTFAGWSTEIDGLDASINVVGSDPKVTFVTLGKTDTTIYATWTPKTMEVPLVVNGVEIKTVEVVIGEEYNWENEFPATAQIGDGEEWMFLGWYDADMNKIDPTTVTVREDDKPIVAYFARIYNILYDAAGGVIPCDGNVDKTGRKVWYTARYGQGLGGTVGYPPLAEKEGYNFLGWFTEDGIKVFDITQVWKLVDGLDELNPTNPDFRGSLPQAAEAPSVQVLGNAGEPAAGVALSPNNAVVQDDAAPHGVDQVLYAKWEKIESPAPPEPGPKPGDGLGWVLPAIGALVLGTGAVTTVGGLSLGGLGLLAAPLTLLLNGLFKLIGRVIPIPGITPVGADPAKSKDYVMPPKTGDDTSLTFGAAMLLLLCGGALPLLIKRRKEELCEE